MVEQIEMQMYATFFCNCCLRNKKDHKLTVNYSKQMGLLFFRLLFLYVIRGKDENWACCFDSKLYYCIFSIVFEV